MATPKSKKEQLNNAASPLIPDGKIVHELPDVNVPAKQTEHDLINSFRENLHSVIKSLEARFREKSTPFVQTGFSCLDDYGVFLRQGELSLIASRPGFGKTSFLFSLISKLCFTEKRSVLFFTFTSNKYTATEKLICHNADVDTRKLESGLLETKDWVSITKAAGRICDAHLLIEDAPSLLITELEDTSREWLQKQCQDNNDKELNRIIIVDGIRSIRSEQRYLSRVHEVGEVSRRLKVLARRLNVPIVVTVGVSEWVERPRASPSYLLSDLHETDGGLEEDADNVLFICRDELETNEESNVAKRKLIVAKNRSGPTGSVYLNLIRQYMKFSEL